MKMYFDIGRSVAASRAASAAAAAAAADPLGSPASAERQTPVTEADGADADADTGPAGGIRLRLPAAGESIDHGSARITAVAVVGGGPFYVVS